MAKVSFKYLFFYLSLLAFSCQSELEYYKASDYVSVGDFTQGLEGPAVDKDGNLFFVNPHHNGAIGKVSSKGEFEIYIDNLPDGSIANGIRFDRNGLMYLADYINHNILTISLKDKSIDIFAHDSTMNQPNDVAISGQGYLFASDPNWAEGSGMLWRANASGTFQLLEVGMGTTNGVEVGPGDSILYVNESVQRNIWTYDVSPSGEISNKRLLIHFDDYGMDGMRCDAEGNLYIARYDKGVIAKVTPDGELLLEIKLKGQKPTNVAFGGIDGKTIFVTCQDRGYIEMFRVEHPGRSWGMRK